MLSTGEDMRLVGEMTLFEDTEEYNTSLNNTLKTREGHNDTTHKQ